MRLVLALIFIFICNFNAKAKEITNLISQNSKVSKKKIYDYCLRLKNEK